MHQRIGHSCQSSETSVTPKKYSLCSLVLLLLVFCSSAFAQQTATITGVVTDQSGAAVPNAGITITNNGTGTSHNFVSSQTGNYTAADLEVGTYTLSAKAPGFKEYRQTGVVLNVNSTLRIDVAFQIGQAQETVTVEANAIQVQSETSEQSSVITGQQIQKIDTNGRNPIQLATLVPGAASSLPDFNAPTALSSNNNISFNGQRPQHNLWMIDGGEGYDRGSGGGMIVNPSPDAIGEFRVMTSNYGPEFGSASGGTISMVLKSGARDFHASAWEFNRNDALDASDFFANRNGTEKPKLRYNAYGFNVGGPVFVPKLYNRDRNKTFFFYNMEWRKLIQGNQITATGIPAAEFNGDFSALGANAIKVPATTDPAMIAKLAAAGYTPSTAAQTNYFRNGIIPASLIDPNARAFLNTGAFPTPNTPDGRFSQAAPVPTNLREEVVRIDHNFTDKLQLMGHLIWDSSQNSYATSLWSGDTYPTIGTQLGAPSYSAVVRLTYSISPTVVNEATYNFNGNKIGITPTGIYARPTGFNVPEYFSPNNLNRLPTINIGTPYGVNYDTASWPWNNVYHAHQFSDDLSWTHGNHNFRFGGSYLRSYKAQDIFGNTNGNFTFNGSFSGNGFADFLLGEASSYNELDVQDAVNIAFNQIGLYANDNWKATSRLTVNLGLRWEGIPHAYDINGRLSNFQPELYNQANRPVFNSDGSLNSTGPGFGTVSNIALSSVPFYLNGLALAGRNGVPQGLVQNHWNNWGPRVGFAYDLGGNQKTVVRGGFGMFYERIQGNDVYNMGPNPPFSYNPTTSNVYFSNPSISAVSGQTASAPNFPSGFTALAYSDYKNPVSMQYSFGIEHQLSESAVMNISYVGSHGYHQPDVRNINTVPLNDPNRLAICGSNCGYSGSNYNANLDRIYPGYSNITLTEAATTTSYNSLQVSVNWHSRHASLQGAYTYSHELDYMSSDLGGNQGGNDNQSYISNPFDRRYDYGSGDFDRRHIAVFSYVYQLPFFRDSQRKFVHSVLGGWEVSGITMFESGLPYTAYLGYDNLGLGGNTGSRANAVSTINYSQNVDAWFSTSSFAAPAALQFGTAGRGTIRGPGRDNWNIALFKSFAIPAREGMHFELRAETYNTFNHTQFNNVNTSFSDTSNFGKITSVFDPRIIQLGAKFIF